MTKHKFTRTSLSLPIEVLKKGKRRAKQRNRNFSRYISDLIGSDNPCEATPKPTA